MKYFVSALKVQFLLWTVIILPTNSIKVKGHLPDLGIISTFLEQFIRPYIDTLQYNTGSLRAQEETAMQKAIRIKIDYLKPLLQDKEHKIRPRAETENNLTLEGNDETTIIEFMPKPNLKKNKDKLTFRNAKAETDPFKMNINKYKALRETIEQVLDKEKTGPKTKNLITRTLDDMIAQLIESQCTWKSIEAPNLQSHVFRTHKDTHRSLNKLHKLTDEQWKSLRKQYLNFLKFKEGQEDSFIKQFHDFFSNVMNDTWNLSHRYKVRCQLVKVSDNKDSSKLFLREDKPERKNPCDSFIVCTDELKYFITSFFTYLNDTSVSTFRNYAAMYIRDVNADVGLDKDIVVSIIENISNTAEKKVSKVFKKELEKFTLDKSKNKVENIKRLKGFITSTVDQVKKVLKKNLNYELGAMKTKLFSTVKEDLNVNLKTDMDNLGRMFADKICALFTLCNGKHASRRTDEPWTFTPKENDNIYVKVQLTLDDELKESIARRGGLAKSWQGTEMTHRFVKNFKIDEAKYSNVSVTRTTVSTTTENSTTITDATTLPEKEIITVGGVTMENNNI